MISNPRVALEAVPSAPSAGEDAIVAGDDFNHVSHRHGEEEEESERFVRSTPALEEDGQGGSPRAALEAYTERLNTARVQKEFEFSLIFTLSLNVLMGYYMDKKLLILFIRGTQVVRLLYYPYAAESAQRNIGWLIFLSNIAVVLIHTISILNNEPPGRMLFINFIGEEPITIFKVFFLDTLVILLELLLLQCRADRSECMLLTSSPKPVTPTLTRLSGQDEEEEGRTNSDNEES